jgi:hypothetical protein
MQLNKCRNQDRTLTYFPISFTSKINIFISLDEYMLNI